jgi:hypothetical protein
MFTGWGYGRALAGDQFILKMEANWRIFFEQSSMHVYELFST